MNHDSPGPHGQTLEDIAAFVIAIGPTGRLIGLDLGTKTIGVALSDIGRTVASGLETIKRKKFTLDAEHLDALIIEHAAAGLVLGLPSKVRARSRPARSRGTSMPVSRFRSCSGMNASRHRPPNGFCSKPTNPAAAVHRSSTRWRRR
jgi:hypothetical protein